MTTKRPTGSAGVLAATGAVVLLIGCCALPALIAIRGEAMDQQDRAFVVGRGVVVEAQP